MNGNSADVALGSGDCVTALLGPKVEPGPRAAMLVLVINSLVRVSDCVVD